MALLLIVDDDPSTLALLEILFKKSDYQVIKADGGHAAIALARKYNPQLILLDLMMPDMDGIAVCRALRKDPKTAKIPIIMLTAARSIEKQQEVMECRVDAYLTKPVQPSELRAQVGKLLQTDAEAEQPKLSKKDRKVIAVIGTTGGAGATTVAINLAASFGKGQETVLAELTPGSCGLAMQLGVTSDRPTSTLNQPASGPAPQDLQAAVREHSSGLKVLVAPPIGFTVNEISGSAGEQVWNIIRELASSHRCVVLDIGREFNSQVRVWQSLIDEYVIVVRADSLALPYSIDQIKLLVESGVSWEQIHIVLVSFGPYPYFFDLEDSKKVLKAGGIQNNVLMYLPAMRQLAYQANEQHMPMVMIDPDGQSLKRYFQEAIKCLYMEEKPVSV